MVMNLADSNHVWTLDFGFVLFSNSTDRVESLRGMFVGERASSTYE
jgi:hypothetical protein